MHKFAISATAISGFPNLDQPGEIEQAGNMMVKPYCDMIFSWMYVLDPYKHGLATGQNQADITADM